MSTVLLSRPFTNLALDQKLSDAVGVGRKNLPADVKLVRGWINAMIEGCFLVPLSKIEDTPVFDGRLKFAIHEVERQYFFGMALPKGDVEPGSNLESFFRNIVSGCVAPDLSARLSSEMYGLAAVMVPGGADTHAKVKIPTGIKLEIQSGHIRKYLPDILRALDAKELTDLTMVFMSFGTIRAETSLFEPIDEGQSRFNTSPIGTKGRHPFDLYDDRDDLGNQGAPDGTDYKGRGFVQLTGRANYQRIGAQIGEDLETKPQRADDPDVAGAILAQFLKNQEARIRDAFLKNDLATARRLVNGGSHGLADFKTAIEAGRQYVHLNVAVPVGKKAAVTRSRKKA